ncbi:hypothetical protein GGR28_001077 [Lewinella aquimaris]|uniref:Uncharacterized protein n=1 Tax=Neolewinella aquimaris TaxID=1835722 RepID=A0A840DYX0_9BACT|nr:hypothetical protein [Neolewinella aquimaris]MBB4078464.1 hypothetical protein [Neolewinella aquimaris]
MLSVISPYATYLRHCRSGISVEVRLGSPESPNCSGLGICGIEPESVLSTTSQSNGVRGYLRIDPPTGRLLIHFTNESLGEEIRQKHFPPAGFSLGHEVQLPNWLVAALRLPAGRHRIEAGSYPTLDDGTFTTLSVRISAADECQYTLRLAA